MNPSYWTNTQSDIWWPRQRYIKIENTSTTFFFSKETYFVDSRVLFPHSILQPDCFHIKWIKDERVACILPLPHWGGKTLYMSLSKDMCRAPQKERGRSLHLFCAFPPAECWCSIRHLTLSPCFPWQGLECSSLASIISHLFFVPFFPRRHGLTKLVQAAVAMKRVKDTQRF